MAHDYLGFEDTLNDDDYGFILDKAGNLKGIWVPEGAEDEDIPDAIDDTVEIEPEEDYQKAEGSS